MSVSETGSHLSQVVPTAENDIELLILLTLSFLCWDGHAPIGLVYAMLGLKLRASWILVRRHSIN